MSAISAEKVKELRDKTGAGMMDCKRALASVGGDLNGAIDFLRKEGTVKASKKAGRATLEGLVAIAASPDRKWVSLVEINCETDFVARTDEFQQFIASVAEHVVKNKPKNLDGLLSQKFSGTNTLQETLSHLIAKIGENMTIRRFGLVGAGAEEVVGSYLHAGSKIGVLVRLKGQGADEVLARDVAMHVAAMAPRYVERTQVPAAVIEGEREVAKASPDLAGKPANILDKILDGKLNRFYSEACLVEQAFIKDPTGKKTVGGYLKEKVPNAQIVDVVRFQVGEEIA